MWRRRSVSCRCRAGVCDNNRFHKNKGRARARGTVASLIMLAEGEQAFDCVGLAPRRLHQAYGSGRSAVPRLPQARRR